MERIKKLLAIPALFICFAGNFSATTSNELNVVKSVYSEPLKASGEVTKIYIECDSNYGTGYKGRIMLRLTNEKYERLLLDYYESEDGYKSCVLEYTNKYNCETNNLFTLEYTKNRVNMSKLYLNMEYSSGGFLNANDCDNGLSKVKCGQYSPDGENVLDNYDEFYFENFQQIYIPDYYQKLDLTMLKISEKYGNTFQKLSCQSATLIIPSDIEWFSKIGTMQKIRRVFELELIPLSNNQYTFGFKDNLFVNPTTLVMSSKLLMGFVKTNYIYFPRNQMENISKIPFTIILRNFGVTGADLSYTFYVKPLFNSVGNCITSQYCIETQSENYSGVYGERIK